MELGRDRVVGEIVSRLEIPAAGAVKVEGTWGSYGSLLGSHIFSELKRPILYIRPHIDDADKTSDDLHTFADRRVELFPAWESEDDFVDATDEIGSERLRIALGLISGKDNFIISTSVQALCQQIPKAGVIKKASLELAVDKQISPEQIVEWLIDNEFERVERIDLPGQFARRGGIIDIYAPLVSEKQIIEKQQATALPDSAEAIRVEFFGDTIESIRQIDLDTQLSSEQIESIDIVSTMGQQKKNDRELFLNLLPSDTIIILEEPTEIEEVANVFLERLESSENLYGWGDIYKAIGGFSQLWLSRFGIDKTDDYLKVNIQSVQQYQHRAASTWAGHKKILGQLVEQARSGKKVQLYCESSAEIKRVNEIVTSDGQKVPSSFKTVLGYINQGFVASALDTIVISHHELFGQYTIRRRTRPIRAAMPIETLSDLNAGDYVVHLSYGIGKFLGIKTIKEKDGVAEYLTIEFADKVKIHVSVHNITLVQKFIGTSPRRPKLSKVGGKSWQKQKEKVAKSVEDLASGLLDVQAKREALGGISFGADSQWQVEFEEAFSYQETQDQIESVGQIKADMQKPIAMDRLLCGDVGYGKTELAMRAAFKAVEGGKQVAILVPTTVLSVQHGRVFTERFADFPISIEVLNRFKTTKQAQDITSRTKAGKVDVLIGTHRLLSGDVGFKDLGLLIIDEEQRFGVEHKEKLKKIRVNVDVLTMTATPIPRTLHMSLLGLRDISSLQTPPLDRRAVVTNVTSYRDDLIRKAIILELNRQGQVFFLHNRVKTIDKKAWEIRELLEGTGVRIGIAHGQMGKGELESTMIDFVMGQIDVLVCTTIIESGLDIPNANTIFIDNADRFGLAQLHQLRGRVGRYKHRAYAYMLLPKSRSVTPDAGRRLKAIEEYSHLGAGFRIALRDLEIRGAGNILGAAQSGHIQTVGYQLYCDLLADAVKRIRNEPLEKPIAVNLDLGFTAYIPKSYIPSDRSRLDVYRKIAAARGAEDLKQIRDELEDVYGSNPDEVEVLLTMAEIRIAADKYDIKSIVVSGQDVVFTFSKKQGKSVESLFAKTEGEMRFGDAKTVYLRLGKNYFEPAVLMTVLKKIFKLKPK